MMLKKLFLIVVISNLLLANCSCGQEDDDIGSDPCNFVSIDNWEENESLLNFSIDEPSSGKTVNMNPNRKITISGTIDCASDLENDLLVYAILSPENGGGYFPQDPPGSIQDGSWKTDVQFGVDYESAVQGAPYEIFAILVSISDTSSMNDILDLIPPRVEKISDLPSRRVSSNVLDEINVQ